MPVAHARHQMPRTAEATMNGQCTGSELTLRYLNARIGIDGAL